MNERQRKELADQGKTPHLSSLDRALAKALGEGLTVGHPDDPAKQSFPEIWKWLTTIYVSKDRMKEPATLNIRAVQDGMAITVYDKALSSSVTVTCTCLSEVFSTLEQALTDPDCPITRGKREPIIKKRKQL